MGFASHQETSFLFLKSKLEKIGLKSNKNVDPCLFISNKVVCLVYVDDTLFYSPKAEWIKETIQKLQAEGMELKVEDSVASFLGVYIDTNQQDGSIYFEIDVVTDKNHLGTADNPLPVTPGMVADVEIITGKRTILAYLLKPILRAKNKAFTER